MPASDPLARPDLGPLLVAQTRRRIVDTAVRNSVARQFSEELHPRVPAGSAGGGQFGAAKGAKKTPAKTRSGDKAPAGEQETTVRRPRTRRKVVIPKGSFGYDPASNHGTGYGVKGGDKNVHSLQQALNRLGFTDSRGRKLTSDGKLGPLTTAAVRKAQRALGVKADGIVSPAFLKQLVAMKTAPRPKARVRKATASGRRAEIIAEAMRKFDPLQKRDPDGKWGDGIPGPGGAIKDALKLAGRIDLADGQTLAGSDALHTDDGKVVPMAWIDNPGGKKTLVIGFGIDDEDEHKWSGLHLGSTVDLDEAEQGKLAQATRQMRDAGAEAEARVRELNQREVELKARQRELIRRQYPNLTKDQAKKLDRVDAEIERLEGRLDHEQLGRESSAADLPPDAKKQYDALEAEIDSLYDRFDGLDDDDDAGISALWGQIHALREQQAQLHELKEDPTGSRTGFVELFKMRQNRIAKIEVDLDTARMNREELLRDGEVPLSDADERELLAVDVELDRVNDELGDLSNGDAVFEGTIPALDGDVVYQTISTDTGVKYRIGVKSDDADEDWHLGIDESATADFTAKELAELERKLSAGAARSILRPPTPARPSTSTKGGAWAMTRTTRTRAVTRKREPEEPAVPPAQIPMTYQRVFPLEGIEILSRAKGGDGRTVEAYAAVFGVKTEVHDQHGDYIEENHPTVFNRTISNGAAKRALVLYNHGYDARGKSGGLPTVPLGHPVEIKADKRGLLTVSRYNDSEFTDSVLAAIKNGDIKAQSYEGPIYKSSPMRVPKVARGAQLPLVTRMEMGLRNYGPTPTPYYPQAEITAVRSAAQLAEEFARLDEAEREELIRALSTTPGWDPETAHILATPHRGPGAEDSRNAYSVRQKKIRLRAELLDRTL